MKLRYLAVAGIAVAIISTAAYAGGMFQNLPVVGYAAGQLCSLFAGDGVTCVEPTPAGPAAMTGNELVPADTQLGNGNQPQTVRVPVVVFGAGAKADVTSPATATIPANTPYYFIDGAQAGAFTISMPAAPTDGQIQNVVCESATVGQMTIAASGTQTLKNAPAAAACVANTSYTWVYNAANTTWLRVR